MLLGLVPRGLRLSPSPTALHPSRIGSRHTSSYVYSRLLFDIVANMHSFDLKSLVTRTVEA